MPTAKLVEEMKKNFYEQINLMRNEIADFKRHTNSKIASVKYDVKSHTNNKIAAIKNKIKALFPNGKISKRGPEGDPLLSEKGTLTTRIFFTSRYFSSKFDTLGPSSPKLFRS